MNNKLTDEEITELVLKLFDGSSFYFQSGRRPGAKTMAELLNKAACAVAELQQRRQADKNYFMYGIAEPDGSAYLDEVCVSRDVSLLQSIADELNISDGTDGYRVVALYTALPLTDNEREELQKCRQFDLREKVRADHAAWADKTFGSIGPVGPLKHLSKEALEAAAAPGDLSEWADMQFLLWDAQRRAGISDEQITLAMVEKLAVNKQREWPEPKDGEPRLHIKSDHQPETERKK